MKYAYLKDTDLKILKAIGIRGKHGNILLKKLRVYPTAPLTIEYGSS